MTEIRRAVHMARTLLSIQRNEIEMIIIIIFFSSIIYQAKNTLFVRISPFFSFAAVHFDNFGKQFSKT